MRRGVDQQCVGLLPGRGVSFLKMRNCEFENDSFSILFTIPLIPIPPKFAKNGLGIGIAILYESAYL